MKITFSSEATYQVAATLLQDLQHVAWPPMGEVSHQPNELSVTVSHNVLASLLLRLATSEPTVLPHWSAQTDLWRLTGHDSLATARLLSHISAFLLPTYGTLPRMALGANEGESTLQDKSSTGEKSVDFVWQTPAAMRSKVVEKLGTWLRLQDEQPRLRMAQLPTYAHLLDHLHGALARADFADAEVALSEIGRRHLCSFENQQFLRIQLLAQRQAWSTIRNDATFAALAKQRLPRTVRAALLQAYHHIELLPFEVDQRFDLAFDRFRQTQPTVQRLLDGRYGLTDEPIVRTFGYVAVQSQDRPALEQLQQLPDLSPATLACLQALVALLPPPSVPVPVAADINTALRRRSYDLALALADVLPDPIERTLNLWRIASNYEGAVAAALLAWEMLTDEEHEWLQSDAAFLAYHAAVLPSPPPIIQTWEAWFEAFDKGLEILILDNALDILAEKANNLQWTPPNLRRLASIMDVTVMGNHSTEMRRSLRRAISILSHTLVNDPQFPQSTSGYAELYESCYNGIIFYESANAPNVFLLTRLLQTLLAQEPTRIGMVTNDLRNWIARPTTQVESAFLELVDLLIDAGAPKPELNAWIREWLDFLLDRPVSSAWPIVRRVVWQELVSSLQVGDDLLVRLKERDAKVATEEEVSDSIAKLPAHFQIGIFAGEAVNSIRRAVQILNQRNPTLKIRIVAADGMNDRVLAAARNVDWAVVMTTYMGHALFYGIEPILRNDPIYPRSRGSVAILEAIEARALSYVLPIV